MSCRSAFSISAGYCSFFHFAFASPSARLAKRFSSAWVWPVSDGSPRKVSALRSSFAASSGSFALSPFSRRGSIA